MFKKNSNLNIKIRHVKNRFFILTEQKEELSFIFPNPAADMIELRNYDVDNFVYEIVTHNNQTVKKGKASGKRIDLTGLDPGLYILRVLDTETPISLRIIKNNFVNS